MAVSAWRRRPGVDAPGWSALRPWQRGLRITPGPSAICCTTACPYQPGSLPSDGAARPSKSSCHQCGGQPDPGSVQSYLSLGLGELIERRQSEVRPFLAVVVEGL